jgi:hypothetical protein
MTRTPHPTQYPESAKLDAAHAARMEVRRGRLTHATVNDTRYAIDADGNVLAPDADGTPDQVNIGRVVKTLSGWRATEPTGLSSTRKTRQSAIQFLVGIAAI